MILALKDSIAAKCLDTLDGNMMLVAAYRLLNGIDVDEHWPALKAEKASVEVGLLRLIEVGLAGYDEAKDVYYLHDIPSK